MDADTEREFDETQRRILEDAGPVGPAQHLPEQDNMTKIHDLQVALVRLAYHCAGTHDGPGSGPTQPGFWLVQVLGEDYDRSILELWKPELFVPTVTQKCGICHEDFEIRGEPGSRVVTASLTPICPRCEPNAHRS